jgi:lipoprotein-anchoring transpeptidase ErfK/SrfK
MRVKLFIIPVSLAVLLLALVVGVHVYDAGRPAQIAKGVRVAGVDVGGLSPSAARARLATRYEAALLRPVVVRHGSRSWRLTAREARVRSNLDAMVREATVESDAGGVLKRTMRRLGGQRLDADLEPDVTYSEPAVIRLVDRIRRAIERPAHDATLTISAAGPSATPGRRGLTVRASTLHAEISRALATPGSPRRLVAKTKKLQPRVTMSRLARQNRVVLVADRAANTLRLYRNLKLEKTYGVAAGQPAWPTPAGQFTIANKAVDPAWSVPTSTWSGALGGKVIPGGDPANPLKARWMGITDGVGIHGTADDGSIGSNASHGCLRMHVADVIDLYPRVPVGAKILIV